MMALAALAMTAACVTPRGDSPEYAGDGYCDGPAGSALVGQPATDATNAEAMRLTHTTKARVIRPGDVVTMDYRMDRVNVEVGEDGRVVRVRCG
jgi:hypothetical protein